MTTAIGIFAIDVSFLVAYIVTVSSKLDSYIRDRRELLDTQFMSKVNDAKDKDVKIDAFLPMFKEHREIEEWKQKVSSIYGYIGYSVLFTFVGLCFGLLQIYPIQGIPPDILLIILGGFFTAYLISQVSSLSLEMRKWKLNPKTSNTNKT